MQRRAVPALLAILTFTLWLPVNPADLREEGRGSRSRGLTGSQQVVAQGTR